MADDVVQLAAGSLHPGTALLSAPAGAVSTLGQQCDGSAGLTAKRKNGNGGPELRTAFRAAELWRLFADSWLIGRLFVQARPLQNSRPQVSSWLENSGKRLQRRHSECRLKRQTKSVVGRIASASTALDS